MGEANERGDAEARRAEAIDAQLGQLPLTPEQRQLREIQATIKELPQKDQEKILRISTGIWRLVKEGGPVGPMAVGLVGATLAAVATQPTIGEN